MGRSQWALRGQTGVAVDNSGFNKRLTSDACLQ